MGEESERAGPWVSARLRALLAERPAVLALAESEVLGADGSLQLDRLAALVARGDVDAGVCSDEELHWLRPDADAPAEPSLDAPALGVLGDEEQDAALAAALRLLVARGDAEVDEQGRVRWRGQAAVLATVRHGAEAVWSVRVDRRGGGTERAAVYRARADVFLWEDIDPAGLHAFLFLSPERQVRWLARALDPEGHAADTAAPQRAASVDGLEPGPTELARRARTATRVWGVRAGSTPVEQAVTAYAACDGVWLVYAAGDDAAADGPVVGQRVGADALVAVCRQLLGVAEQPPS